MSNSSLITIIDNIISNNNCYSKKKTNNNWKKYLLNGLNSIKLRSKTIIELIDNAHFYIFSEVVINKELLEHINDNKTIIQEYYLLINKLTPKDWYQHNLHDITKDFAIKYNLKLGEIAKLIRIILTGKINAAASNFEIMEILGQSESIERFKEICNM